MSVNDAATVVLRTAAVMLANIDGATPIGTPVIVVKDDGRPFYTSTRSEIWMLGHGQLVVNVHGISGGYAVERVFVLPRAT